MQPAGTEREEFGQKRRLVHYKIVPKKLPPAHKDAGPAQQRRMPGRSVGSANDPSTEHVNP